MVQGGISDVLSGFGTLKNPVLLSSGSFSGSMLYFGQLHASEAVGMMMIFLATFVFLTGMGFYAYAFLRLPANAQEQLFLQEAKVALAQHEAAAQRRRAGRNKPPAADGDT